MAYIHWDQPFFVNSATGEVVPVGTEGAVALPTYGNYGGAGYSAGEFGGEPPTTPSGRPLSRAQLTQLGSDSEDPVDRLDYLYYKHDLASDDVGEPYTRD